jgi:hypothetical protein
LRAWEPRRGKEEREESGEIKKEGTNHSDLRVGKAVRGEGMAYPLQTWETTSATKADDEEKSGDEPISALQPAASSRAEMKGPFQKRLHQLQARPEGRM